MYRPEEFAKMVDLKTENVWSIVTTVMKRLMQARPFFFITLEPRVE